MLKSPIMQMEIPDLFVVTHWWSQKNILEDEASVLIQWFDNNLFKINAEKSHVLMATTK